MHVQFRVAGGQERDACADRDGCGDRSGHPPVNDTTTYCMQYWLGGGGTLT